MNFVYKTNIFDFFGTLEEKGKQTILKTRWFYVTNRNTSPEESLTEPLI